MHGTKDSFNGRLLRDFDGWASAVPLPDEKGFVSARLHEWRRRGKEEGIAAS